MEAEVSAPPRGMRFEKDGDTLVQYYTPHAFGRGMRCYCALMRGLPEGANASLTYCLCGRAFVEKYWKRILGRSVRVELAASAISGADECKFIVHL